MIYTIINKERKPDLLKKSTDSSGRVFILHIEYQVAQQAEMVYRMAEYYMMLHRKYKLPVEQFVFFLGGGKPEWQLILATNGLSIAIVCSRFRKSITKYF